MPRKQQQLTTKQRRAYKTLSQFVLQEIGKEIIVECEKILPNSPIPLSDAVEIEANPTDLTIRFNETFDPILLPAQHAGESVFQIRGANPNTGTPYSYSAETKQHFRKTERGIVPVRAHTKHYELGYKPVEGKGGWYTASPKNNFGLRMAQLRIQKNFVQEAYDKVYKKLPKEYRKQLPKAIQIKE
jgi:hypothetical protein